MKYCMDFNKNYLSLDVDEINIQYDKILSLDSLVSLTETYKKRLNICFKEENMIIENIKEILDLNNEYLYIRLPFKTPTISDQLKREYPKINLFFETQANTWDIFIGLVKYGVTDIYITEGLGFELDKISKIAKENNIQIRTFPNVAQTGWTDNDDVSKFWIRPEDTPIYEQYIDVYEFWDSSKFNIYYKIYKEDKKWFGNLKEIIIDLKENLDSRFLIPEFAQKRFRCGRRCLKGDNCKICYEIIKLSKSLEEANLIIRNKKDREEERDG